MNLDIITPDELVYSGKIQLIKVPGASGSFEVLKNHAPIISTLDKGTIKVVEANEEKTEHFFNIDKGLIEVNHNNVIVLLEKK
jgi:F-type H+-transporting ATPase subunit epsilon